MDRDLNPLVAAPPAEIPLKNAPLVRVIAQIQFPEILAIGDKMAVAPFQETLRKQYPVLRQEQTQALMMSPAGVVGGPMQTTWRFNDNKNEWRLSLAPQSLSLETTKYTSRADFFARLRNAMVALEQHFSPSSIDRLGVRYIDRIIGQDFADIDQLVRPEVRGILTLPMATAAAHSISETLFDVDGSQVLARWGRLPAHVTVDPSAIEPVAESSWILDLDMFSVGSVMFEVDGLTNRAAKYAERLYTIFRWAVTDQFLARFGANS
jgi:uncharacterized protein (TIGR04255 family)